MAAALLACGGSDPVEPDSSAADNTAEEAVAEEATADTTAGGAAARTARSLAPVAPAVTRQGCLGMIGQGKFELALASCLAALEADPDNAELQAAVEKARAAQAGLADDAAAALE